MICFGGCDWGVEVSSGVRSSSADSNDSTFPGFECFEAVAAKDSKPSDPLKYTSRVSFIGNSEELVGMLVNVAALPFRLWLLLVFCSASLLSCKCGISTKEGSTGWKPKQSTSWNMVSRIMQEACIQSWEELPPMLVSRLCKVEKKSNFVPADLLSVASARWLNEFNRCT